MEMEYLVRFFLKNRVNRFVFSLLSQKDGRGRCLLEDIISLYTEEENLSWRKRISLFPFYLFFEGGRILFGQRREETRRYLSNRIFRKGILLTLRSVAEYGPTYPQVFLAPPVVVWNFTNRCNLKCRHCYQNAGKRLPGELSLKERLRIVDELGREGVFSLAFSGGEPLIDKDLFPVIERAKKHDMYVSIATNGILITPQIARRMSQAGVDYVEISLDSTREEIHDEFRGFPGAWRKTVEGIENAVAEQTFKVGMASTITQLNFLELEDLIRFSIKLGVHKFFAFNFIPVGQGERAREFDLTPEEREKMLNILFEYHQEGKIVALTTCPQYARVCIQRSGGNFSPTTHYSTGKGSSTALIAEFMGGCGVGRAYCALQPDGKVTPCVYLPVVVGDLRKEKFRDIWLGSPLLHALRKREDLKENCGKCRFRRVCGGCRARAYAYFKDFKAPDPGCINNKNVLLSQESLVERSR